MKNLKAYGINPAKKRSYEKITYVLALVYQRLQDRADAYLARQGINSVQFNLLMLAAYQNQGKGLSQVELANRLIVSASNMTKMVEKSVQNGWLTREQNPHKRRENIIRITPKGQQLIDAVWPGYDKLVRKMTEYIPPSSRKTAETILNRWLEKLEEEK